MAKKRAIGAIIKLDGESTFKASVSSCKSALGAMKAELVNIQAKYAGNANSLEALSAVQEKYAEMQKTAKGQIENLTRAYENSQKKTKEVKEQMKKMLEVYEESEKKLRDMKDSGEASAEAIQKQEVATAAARDAYDRYATAVEKCEGRTSYFKKALEEAKTEERASGDAVKKYAKYIEEAENSADGCTSSIDKLGNEMEDMGDATESAGGAMAVFAGNIASSLASTALNKITDAAKEAAKYVVEVGSKFEYAMKLVEARSGATADDIAKIKEKAEELGRNTMYSAEQAANSFSAMAIAGWTAQEMLAAISSVLDLAKNSEIELADASSIVTDNIAAFGLKAEDASLFVDKMAYAQANSNLTTTELAEAYKNCASTAGRFGYSVSEVTSALMTMANSGVKGGEAGTALNAIMVRLATNTKGSADALKQYGVQIYDETGSMRDLGKILIETAGAFSTLNDEEQANLAKIIAGQNQYASFQTILAGLSDAAKENGKSFEDYTRQLDNCAGSAAEMSAIMSDNLKGDTQALSSAVEGLGNTLYEVFGDKLRSAVQAVTEDINGLTDSIKPQETTLRAFINTVEDANTKISDSISKAESSYSESMANAVSIQSYIEIIEEARSKTKLTEYETFQLNNAVETLSTSFPELNEYIGNTSELLKMSASDFGVLKTSMVKSYKEIIASAIAAKQNAYLMAKADAEIAQKQAKSAYEASEKEIYNQQKKIYNLAKSFEREGNHTSTETDDYWKRQQKEIDFLHQLEDERDRANDSLQESTEAYKTASEKVSDYQELQHSLYKEYGLFIDQNGRLTTSTLLHAKSTEEAAESADDMSESVSDAAKSYSRAGQMISDVNIAGLVRTQLADAIESVENFRESFKNSLGNFSLFDDTESLMDIYTSSSKKEMEKNAKISLDLMGKYTDELKNLADRGLSKEFLSYLTEQGASGLEYVHTLATWTSDAELKQFQAQFDEFSSYADGTNEKVTDMMNSYAENIMEHTMGGYEAWYAYGIQTTQGLFDAIDKAKELLASGEVTGEFEDAMKSVLEGQSNLAIANRSTQTRLPGSAPANKSTETRMTSALPDITVNMKLEMDGDELSSKITKRIQTNQRMTGRR